MPDDLSQVRALIDHAPMMLRRSGLDAKCDYVNAAWLAFTGRGLDQELGDGWLAGAHPDDREQFRALYLDHFARRQSFEMEYRLRRHDGVYRYILDRGVPYDDSGGSFAGFLGSCIDVEDRRQQGADAGADAFFEIALDNLSVVGFDGWFKRLNPSWTKTLGWTAAELMSRPSIEFLHPDDRDQVRVARTRLQAGLSIELLVNRYRCKDGTYRWFEWRSVAHVDRKLVYAAARDVTDQRAAEADRDQLLRQLILADRLASVGTLAAGVAHEINNPLAYVMTNLDMLIEELTGLDTASLPAQLADWVEMATEARQGAERIRKIVRGMKTFSRAEEERRTVVDVRPVLELSINMTFNEIRHRARLVKDYGDIPMVEADDARLGQIFINLLVNAAQAIPEGDSEGNEIRIVTATDALGRAVIEIRDTGSGIPANVIERVFDPFFTTKAVGVGTGLGLSICHSIVASMGGEITASNRAGRGASFRVALPGVARPVPAPPAANRTEHAVPSRRATVLVVDDERAVGIILGRLLKGHDVTITTTAREALDLIVAGARFDVVLSDLMMPEMSGMELYDELLHRCPEAAERMVFVTGGAFTPAANAFLDRVPNERLEKPFNLATVRALVDRFAK